MEDIPRDLQKELESYQAPQKNRKAAGHWTLLFVGAQGEVITIRKFKGLMLLAFFIMIVALSAAGSIYMLYKKPFEENQRLEVALAKADGRVRALAEERDLMLTRLGILESKLKKAQAPEPEIPPADTVSPIEDAAGTPAPAATSPESRAAGTEPAVTPEKPAPPPADDVAVKPEVEVDVRDFQVRHDPQQNLLNVQFRLKNVNVEAGAVSGRTFVVLANDQDETADALTFPRVRLVDGKPGRIHLGRYFSISRFNIVKFKGVYKEPSRVINRATVFVYSGAGDLLLEKNFTIENPFKETAAAAPDAYPETAGAVEGQTAGEGRLPDNSILND